MVTASVWVSSAPRARDASPLPSGSVGRLVPAYKCDAINSPSLDLDRLDRQVAQNANHGEEWLEGRHAVEARIGQLDVGRVHLRLVERSVDCDPAAVDIDVIPHMKTESP